MQLHLLLLISLHAIVSTQVTRDQGLAKRSNVCQNNSNTPPHNLSCPANTSIFILEAENGFGFSPLSSCADNSDMNCCPGDNFNCSAPISNDKFGPLYTSCWGKVQILCTAPAVFESSVFIDGSQMCSGAPQLSTVSYQCINSSSVLPFDDGGNVSGTAVVAKYLNTETNVSSCLEPNNTLECDVTVIGNSGSEEVRVMLVMQHTQLFSPCSTLNIANVSTGNHSCNVYTYKSKKVTVTDVSKKLKISLTLHKDDFPVQAWAVISTSTATLQMTCGKGTCTTSRVDSSTSAPDTDTPATTNSNKTPAPSPSVTTTENSSIMSSSPTPGSSSRDTPTSPGSSIDSSRSTYSPTSSAVTSNDSAATASFSSDSITSPSNADTSINPALPERPAEQAGSGPLPVPAIAGGVAGGAIAVVLVIVIIVICYRRRSSAKEFHDSDDGKVNQVALDDIKLEPESRPLEAARPPSAYEEVDDPVPGHRKVSYSSIRFEDEAPPPADDSESDYDHLHQRRPTSKPDDTYGSLDEVEADDDPDYSYDHLGGSIKRGTPDPEASQDDPYSHLHAVGKTPDAEPGDVAGSADDVTKDATATVTADDVTKDVTADVTADDVTKDSTAEVTADVNTEDSIVSDSKL